MKLAFFLHLCIFTTTLTRGQEVVEVECSETSMTAKIQKQLVSSANHQQDTIHLNDKTCVFDDEEGEFYVKEISPITSCGTHYTANETHVEFTNSISTVDTGPTYPYGVVVGNQSNNMILSALISCTYRIDLTVSVQFIPNITVIVIQMPDAYGRGEFSAAMAIYTDQTYLNAYEKPPTMAADATVYVGVNLINNVSSDIYLLIQECWGTISPDPDSMPKYPLIEDGCPISTAADGLVRVTQNGVGHQAMWNSPVFKFVGKGEAYNDVWLHCNLQLCINESCEPTCARRRKRREIGNGEVWKPSDSTTPYIISLGPVRRITVSHVKVNRSDVTRVEIIPEQEEKPSDDISNQPSFWSPSAMAVVAAMGALVLIFSVIMVIALRNRQRSNGGFNLGENGVINKSFT